jgi:PAS domain S-box-containing protein
MGSLSSKTLKWRPTVTEQELRLDLALDLANLGLWDFNPHATYLQWSGRAKQFFGLSADRPITYEMFLNSLHPEDRDRTHKAIQDSFNPEIGRYEIEFRTIGIEDGYTRIIFAKGVVHFDETSQPTRIIGISMDLTNQRLKEQELQTAREKADLANEAKTQFLANMSHEIRTPLTAIIGFTDLALDQSSSTEDRMGYLETIRRNGELLMKLINQLLDISKAEANKIEIEDVRFSLTDALKSIIPALRIKAQAKGLELSIKSEGKIPAQIETDPTRFKQILNNLIGNAIKFTEKGQIDITVRVKHPIVVGRRMTMQISIKDTGIGISEENQKKLFQRFSQADNSVTRKFGGTGLGLALSRQLAQALGGDVYIAHSSPGQGSEFIFEFQDSIYDFDMPFLTLNIDSLLKNSPPEQRQIKSLDGLRVLLAEDAPDNQVLVSLFLKTAGAHVDIAQNGVEALERAQKEEYDVVLMDIQMPELNGYKATEALRESGFTKPIIALTAHAMEEERERCLRSGFNDYLTKPVNRKRLIREIAEFANH